MSRSRPLSETRDFEDIQTLAGRRGSPEKHALRRSDLRAVRAEIESAQKELASILKRAQRADNLIRSIEDFSSDIEQSQKRLSKISQEIQAVAQSVEDVEQTFSDLSSTIDGLDDVSLTAQSVTDDPTESDHNAVVSDLSTITDRLNAVMAALRDTS